MKIPNKRISLPPLPYYFDGLEPITSSEALKIHYKGHHGSYVKNFNRLLQEGGSKRDLEFNYFGHILHSRLWENLGPEATQIGPKTSNLLAAYYSHPTEFIQEMVEYLSNIKGSGWAIAGVDRGGNLRITAIPNHSLNLVSNLSPLLVLDAWEHAYYLDYANKKKDYFKKVIDLINWDTIEKRVGGL